MLKSLVLRVMLLRFVMLFAFFMSIWASTASATVTLPDLGIVLSDYITAAFVTLGVAIGACIGGYFSLGVLKASLNWVSRLLFRR